MTRKKAGWILIGFAVLLGILRLADVIDNTVTAVLFMLGVIIYSGAAKKYKKMPEEPASATEDQVPPSTPADTET